MEIKNIFEPPFNCTKCPRLSNFRKSIKIEYPSWHNKPVRSFGSINSKKLIVGLAPGKKGANRTGRPFTGDGAGETLFKSLIKNNLAIGDYNNDGFDKLKLLNCRITNIVKCVPPKNRPKGEEIINCSFYEKMIFPKSIQDQSGMVPGSPAHEKTSFWIHWKLPEP